MNCIGVRNRPFSSRSVSIVNDCNLTARSCFGLERRTVRSMRSNFLRVLLPSGVALGALLFGSCYSMRPSHGAGQTDFSAARKVDARDVALPPGYAIEVIASGLTFPTGITFDETGRAFVVESGYSYGEVFTEPRLLEISAGGETRVIARGQDTGPWTGVAFHQGNFFVAAGDVRGDGKILRIAHDGSIATIVDGLPSRGDHHTNGPVIGPDGWLYFAQGTATNSSVAGEDNAKFGWLGRFPEFHDIPGQDVTLTGVNYGSGNPLTHDPRDKATTGAFLPFGTPSHAGQIIKGQVKCSGSLLRVRPEGGEPELIAWGFRNPFGLAFSPSGTLHITDNGYDDRGGRPVWGAPDFLWAVEEGNKWFGWPDFVGGDPVTSDEYKPPGKPPLQFVLAEHPQKPPKAKARFPVHSSADGFDFSRSDAFGHRGEAFVALFGDEAPATGKVLGPVGCSVVRVDPVTGVVEDFAVNRNRSGPASRTGGAGLERPVTARFSPDGRALYVVDFGVMLHGAKGAKPQQGTGVVWRITRR